MAGPHPSIKFKILNKKLDIFKRLQISQSVVSSVCRSLFFFIRNITVWSSAVFNSLDVIYFNQSLPLLSVQSALSCLISLVTNVLSSLRSPVLSCSTSLVLDFLSSAV